MEHSCAGTFHLCLVFTLPCIISKCLSAHASRSSFCIRQFSAFRANVSLAFHLHVGPVRSGGFSIHITDSGPYGQHVRVQPGPAFCGTRNCVICRRHLGFHNQFTTCGKCYLAATAAQHLEGVDLPAGADRGGANPPPPADGQDVHDEVAAPAALHHGDAVPPLPAADQDGHVEAPAPPAH